MISPQKNMLGGNQKNPCTQLYLSISKSKDIYIKSGFYLFSCTYNDVNHAYDIEYVICDIKLGFSLAMNAT